MPALLATLLMGCGNGASGGASASCVAPYLGDQPRGETVAAAPVTAAPGDTVSLFGHWYTTTCNDTGGHDPLQPMHPVRLTLTLPDGRTMSLGEFTPHGKDMGFDAQVHIPVDATAGTATVRDSQRHPSTYRITIQTTAK